MAETADRVLTAAERDLADAERGLKDHLDKCPIACRVWGCKECRQWRAHIAFCQAQIKLLAPPVPLENEALW